MNQILSTEDPNKKKTKYTNNSTDLKKIVKVFSIAILIFGAILIGIYSYKLINKNKITKLAKPEVTLEQLENEVAITAKAEAGINKVIYYWNSEEQTEKPLNGSSEYNEAIEIPNGENTLTVKAIDQNGQVVETSGTYIGTKDTEKPKIVVDEEEKTKIIITDETELSYVTYKWEDEDDENLVKVEAQPEEGEEVPKKVEINITAKKGTNTLIVTAVDAAGNTETLRKIYKGVTDPEIEVYREGEKLYLKITHELGFKKVEFSINGQSMTYDDKYSKYEPTKKELFYSFDLKDGKNEVAIVATSNEDTQKTYVGQCQYP